MNVCGVHHMTEQAIGQAIGQATVQVPYKLSHKNHPCSIWARQCIENYIMEKSGFCNWKNREIPNWYKINLDN